MAIFNVFTTTTTTASTTGPAGTYFTTTFTNDLALILIKKIKKREMSRQSNNNKRNHMCSPMAVSPSDISGNDWRGPVNSSPAADCMSDVNFVANFLSRNYRWANPVVEKSIA